MKIDFRQGLFITGIALVIGLVLGLAVVPLLAQPFPIFEHWHRPWQEAIVHSAGMAVAFGLIFSFVKLSR